MAGLGKNTKPNYSSGFIMTEDDTFERLKRVPAAEVYQTLINGKMTYRARFEYVEKCGWTRSEYTAEIKKLLNYHD